MIKELRETYKLGSSSYKMKPIDNELENAISKVQEMLQREENKRYGKKAKTVTFAYAGRYIYRNYLKGRSF